MIPNVVRLWREHGATDCTCCRVRDRCVYTKTLDGQYHELCWSCWKTKFSSPLRAHLLEAIRAKAHPVPRDGFSLRKVSLSRLHWMALEAFRLRLYVQPVEARASGLKSLEGAIRDNCAPLKWIVGRDPIFDMTISKTLPRDQRPAHPHVAGEEAS